MPYLDFRLFFRLYFRSSSLPNIQYPTSADTANVLKIKYVPNDKTEVHKDACSEISLSINELEQIYTCEEEKYASNVLQSFENYWRGINVGEGVINAFVQCAMNTGPLPSDFYLVKVKLSKILKCHHLNLCYGCRTKLQMADSST